MGLEADDGNVILPRAIDPIDPHRPRVAVLAVGLEHLDPIAGGQFVDLMGV